MKVEQGPEKFTPVVITLESQDEAEIVASLLYCIDGDQDTEAGEQAGEVLYTLWAIFHGLGIDYCKYDVVGNRIRPS